jgi:hypothetical protein
MSFLNLLLFDFKTKEVAYLIMKTYRLRQLSCQINYPLQKKITIMVRFEHEGIDINKK